MTTEMTPLWKPSAERIADANITRFIDFVNRERGAGLTDYDSLFDWSVTELESFWDAVWDFTGIIGEKGDTILKDGDKMPGAAFFPDAKVNFAENLLRRRDNSDAIVFWGEDKVKRRMSFSQLYDEVSKFAQALKAEGVGPGDRVAAFMPNMPETIVATLATASLG
ncbi:MAG: AMP-binding protein, partial [Nisaea sp.]